MTDSAFEPAVIRVLNPDTMRLEPLAPNVAVCFYSYEGDVDSVGRPAFHPMPNMKYALVHHLGPTEPELNIDQFLDCYYGVWHTDAFQDTGDRRINVPGRCNTGSTSSDGFHGEYRTVDPRFQTECLDALVYPASDEPFGLQKSDYVNGSWEVVPGTDDHELSAAEDWGYRNLHSAGALYVQHPVNGKLYPMTPNNLVGFLLCTEDPYLNERVVTVYSLNEYKQEDVRHMDTLMWFEQFLPLILLSCYGKGSDLPNGDNVEIGTGVWYSTMERFLPHPRGR